MTQIRKCAKTVMVTSIVTIDGADWAGKMPRYKRGRQRCRATSMASLEHRARALYKEFEIQDKIVT
jgi:hypothetical protein